LLLAGNAEMNVMRAGPTLGLCEERIDRVEVTQRNEPIAEYCQSCNQRIVRLQGSDGNLDVDDRLGVEPRYGRRPDVFHTQRVCAENPAKRVCFRLEGDRPHGIVGNDLELTAWRLRAQGKKPGSNRSARSFAAETLGNTANSRMRSNDFSRELWS
jgi:hypothetical protein